MQFRFKETGRDNFINRLNNGLLEPYITVYVAFSTWKFLRFISMILRNKTNKQKHHHIAVKTHSPLSRMRVFPRRFAAVSAEFARVLRMPLSNYWSSVAITVCMPRTSANGAASLDVDMFSFVIYNSVEGRNVPCFLPFFARECFKK